MSLILANPTMTWTVQNHRPTNPRETLNNVTRIPCGVNTRRDNLLRLRLRRVIKDTISRHLVRTRDKYAKAKRDIDLGHVHVGSACGDSHW
jgi:hypothetical protein